MGFISSRRKADGGYTPPIIHELLKPNTSGNTINGVGELKPRRPTPVYHHTGIKYPYRWIEHTFHIKTSIPFTLMNKFREALRLEKTTLDPISSERVNHEPKIRSENLKKYALSNGADIVGITRMREEWVFEGYEIEEPWIILLGVKMDNTKLLRIAEKGRDVKGGAHIIEVYNHGTRTAHKLANWIRSAGWSAKGRCGPIAGPVNILPAAIEAGIGVLGKHGSLINSNLGPSFRIAYVLTELPLLEDEPSDIDVDGFCSKCKLCSKRCPPNAIHTDKRLVRGVEKWYVDFDRCLPYFNDSYGCGICVAVCPWSQPGVAKKLSLKYNKKD